MSPPDARIDPILRPAVAADLPTVVALWSIPDEGAPKVEDPTLPLDPRYAEALADVDADPNNLLLVAEHDGRVVGALQLTIIQHVAYLGGRIAQVENVIVDPALRGRGVGEAMMRWAIDEARRRACFRVQLTSNKARARAHRFYARLGFTASHEGMKLRI